MVQLYGDVIIRSVDRWSPVSVCADEALEPDGERKVLSAGGIQASRRCAMGWPGTPRLGSRRTSPGRREHRPGAAAAPTVTARTSARSPISKTLATAGGQSEQPWLWKSSMTVGCAASAANGFVGKAASAARLTTSLSQIFITNLRAPSGSPPYPREHRGATPALPASPAQEPRPRKLKQAGEIIFDEFGGRPQGTYALGWSRRAI